MLPNEQLRPEFRAGSLDMDGPWGWRHFDTEHMQEMFHRIFDAQKLTWQTLREGGSHLVEISALIPEARKRLDQIAQGVPDSLYSLRVCNRKRIWSIKKANVLWLLWWDPNHEVCPSYKKHT